MAFLGPPMLRSGTTGLPKGVVLSHGIVVRHALGTIQGEPLNSCLPASWPASLVPSLLWMGYKQGLPALSSWVRHPRGRVGQAAARACVRCRDGAAWAGHLVCGLACCSASCLVWH